MPLKLYHLCSLLEVHRISERIELYYTCWSHVPRVELLHHHLSINLAVTEKREKSPMIPSSYIISSIYDSMVARPVG